MNDLLGFCFIAAVLFLAAAGLAILTDLLTAWGWLGDEESDR